jgi:hypothetical protein
MNATKTNKNKKFTKRQMTKAERAAIVAKKKAEKEHRKQEYNKKQETTKTVSSKEAKSYFTCLDSESDADSEEKVKPMTLIHPDLLEYKYDPTRRWADMVDSSDDDDDDKMFGDNRKWDVSATTDMSSMFNESFSNNSRHR